jgi:hypothetical protein
MFLRRHQLIAVCAVQAFNLAGAVTQRRQQLLVCSPSVGGFSRTPRRWPSMVKGHSVVGRFAPARAPSGSVMSASPPVASRCSSS